MRFRSSSPSDERLMLPLFSPYIEQGEIAHLPTYNFYIRIAALDAQEPVSGVTRLVTAEDSYRSAEVAKAHSRERYGLRQVTQNREHIVSQRKNRMSHTKKLRDQRA